MADEGKLVFLRPHDGTGRLVFGDESEVSAPATEITIDAEFADDMAATVQLLWDANVSREEMVFCRVLWQAAEPASARTTVRWQECLSATARAGVRWQVAEPAASRTAVRWQYSDRITARTGTRWQNAHELRHTISVAWQEANRLRARVGTRWQNAEELRHTVSVAWQEGLRLRSLASTRWQTAVGASHRITQRSGAAQQVRHLLATRWQEARRPLAGQSTLTQPELPVDEPCYDPATLGQLEFWQPWANDGRLVFVCKTTPLPPAGIVIPTRSTYVVQNSVILYRLPAGTEFKAESFVLDIDKDSWTFGWSASLHSSARAHLARSAPDERVEVECVVNGVPYRLAIDSMGRDRSFPESRIAVRGRGRAAELDDVDLPFGSAAPRTAQQLMADVLTVNGVSLGWTLDWQIDDWLVPADTFLFGGSYIGALRYIADAAKAYIQPHPTDKVLRVLPLYRHAPWDWATLLTPDIELPAAVTSVVNIEEVMLPRYNQVFVGGVNKGVFGPVIRNGTVGGQVAPQVLHPLITAAAAHIQCGRGVLSDTGLQEHYSLQTMVLPETGIILPDKALRFVDEDGPHLGVVRKTRVHMDTWPELYQTLGVETHVE